jgi:hypothetical protein
MPANEFEGFEDLSSEPIEVGLVEQVTKCRTCNWFWRPAPYGPCSSFDFTEDFPDVLRERTSSQFKDKEFARSIPGLSRPQAFVNPQILHGCRKAPIMTIGINPNLTGFWPTTDGGRWAYPLFSNFARYAYYYRHRTTHQESFPLDFIREHVLTEGAVRAKKPGRITNVKRDMVKREMKINITYEDGTAETCEQTWNPENHFVIFHNQTFDGEPQFQAGEIIGGFVDIPEGAEVRVEQNVVGYYQRVIPILEQVSAFLRSRGELPNMELAEDVCQLDMVACASPGWGEVYKIDKQEVVKACVHANTWVIKQLIQSNPKVILFSGRSAFDMFNQIFKPFVVPAMWDNMDVYGLLKMTARDPHYLDIKFEDGSLAYHLRARLVIAPHFSYDENFVPHSRFSAEEWERFKTDFPEAVIDLEKELRVTKPNRDDYRGISVENLKAFQDRHPVATIVIIQNLVDPSALIGQGISQEILMENIPFNEEDGHLERAPGPCRFCVNGTWSFPEGCPYGKDKEEVTASDAFKRIVDYVIRSLDSAAYAGLNSSRG